MRIESIIGFNTTNIQDKKSKSYNISFMNTPEVSKTLESFGARWYQKLPVTFRNLYNNLKDKSKLSPLQVFSMAFAGLSLAKTVQDVKNIFPQECEEGGFFTNLKDKKDTKATDGILSVYREYKELYPNGILKNGEDITVYLLKKLYLEGKTREQINSDLETDLIEDIKNEFNRKFPESKREYIGNGSLRKTYGIKFLEQDCFTSFLQTQEEFNKKFRESCSEAQKKRYSSENSEQGGQNEIKERKVLTPEQIDAIRKRNKEHWEALSSSQQANVIAMLNEGYRAYWNKLPKEEQDKRIQLMLAGLKKLTPAQTTELINKIKTSNEHLRYAMYDAWNNSIDLILELSKFLKSKHGLKPADIYSAKEFSKFQSKIMTEFWMSHREMAEDFGLSINVAREKIDAAVKDGKFEELKKQIEEERDIRIQLIDAEKQLNEQPIKRDIKEKEILKTEEAEKTEVKTLSQNITKGYEKDFKDAYQQYMNRSYLLPNTFIDDVVNIIVNGLPSEKVQQMTEKCRKYDLSIDDIANIFKENEDNENYKKVIRTKKALEGAMSYVLYTRIIGEQNAFSMDYNKLLYTYRQKICRYGFIAKHDIACCQRKYNEFKNSMSENGLDNIVNRYFVFYSSKDAEQLKDYINLYGRTISLLFSDAGEIQNDARIQFNEKFLREMPEELKNNCYPVITSVNDLFAEEIIQKIKNKVIKRYSFMPKEFLEAYGNEVVNTIHAATCVGTKQAKELYSIKSFVENVCNTKSENVNGEEYTNYPYLKIPKSDILRENKIKFLAAEQALADELFRVTGDKKIYEIELEELMNIFEIFTIKNIDRVIFDDKGNKRFEAKETPNRYTINENYKINVKELNENANEIFENDEIKDPEELVYALNTITGYENHDEYIAKRVKAYYDEQE